MRRRRRSIREVRLASVVIRGSLVRLPCLEYCYGQSYSNTEVRIFLTPTNLLDESKDLAAETQDPNTFKM